MNQQVLMQNHSNALLDLCFKLNDITMKLLFLSLIPLLLYSACKKDVSACKDYKEITGKAHLIDLNTIDAPDFIDTLAKHSQLQAYHFDKSSATLSMDCYVFYKDLPLFSDYYHIVKDRATNQITTLDTIFTGPLAISLEPAISYKDAIKYAKSIMNFDHTCISYRLGLYNINYGNTLNANYKLVWKVEGEKGFPFVIMDASTKHTFLVSSGIFIID